MTRYLPLLVLLACEPAPTTRFDASTLTPEQLVAAEDAASQWCEATDGRCCPTLTGGPNVLRVEQPSSGVGQTQVTGGRVRVVIRPDIQDLEKWGRIVRHEFGHVCRWAAGKLDPENPHLGDGHVMCRTDECQPVYLTKEDVEYATPSG